MRGRSLRGGPPTVIYCRRTSAAPAKGIGLGMENQGACHGVSQCVILQHCGGLLVATNASMEIRHGLPTRGSHRNVPRPCGQLSVMREWRCRRSARIQNDNHTACWRPVDNLLEDVVQMDTCICRKLAGTCQNRGRTHSIDIGLTIHIAAVTSSEVVGRWGGREGRLLYRGGGGGGGG